MIQTILGIKYQQSQEFDPSGKRIPVTYILTGPMHVVDVKTVEKDGYNAIQIGFGSRRIATLTKPEIGHVKKAGMEKIPPRFLKEVKFTQQETVSDMQIQPGTIIKAEDILKEGDTIQVIGISKGKGFQGVVKRHHFKGGPRTHGQSDRERAPGAIGQTTTPGRVYKGKRMAGRMGGDQVTVKNLKVVHIDSEKNLITISGLVPGGKNSLLLIEKLST